MNLAVTNDEVTAGLLTGTELGNQIITPAAIDLAHDFPDTGEKAGHKILRPALQRLTHDGVIGISNRSADNSPCFVPAEEVFVHENAHQFRNDQGGVRIIDLDNVVLSKGPDITPTGNVLANDILCGSRDEEILLLQTKRFAFDMIVSRIEDLGNDLCHGAVFHTGDILALREEVHVKRVNRVGIP